MYFSCVCGCLCLCSDNKYVHTPMPSKHMNINTQTVLLCSARSVAPGMFSVPPSLIITLVIKVRAVVKHTNPLTSHELSHYSTLEADARCQTLSPTTSLWISLGMNLRDRSKGLPMPPPRESDSGAETAGAWGGQKCNLIKQPPPSSSSDLLPGLTETGQTPTMLPAISASPEGSSRQLRNSG